MAEHNYVGATIDFCYDGNCFLDIIFIVQSLSNISATTTFSVEDNLIASNIEPHASYKHANKCITVWEQYS